MTELQLQPGEGETPPGVAEGETVAFLQRLDPTPRRVAVIRASRLGDLLLAVPALRALRAALPSANIALIGHPAAQLLAERLDAVNRFIPLPAIPRPSGGWQLDPHRAAPFFAAMRAEHFDLALQLHGFGFNANPLTLMLGARHTAGFDAPAGPAGRLDLVFPRPERMHEVQRLLAFMAFLGVPDTGEGLVFPLMAADRVAAAALVAGARPPLIAIHGGAHDSAKRWPAGRFAAAGAEIARRVGGSVVVLGVEGAPYAAFVRREADVASIDLTGRTDLFTLGAVIERCTLLLTNDSAPAHIAYALGTPTVTIFGPTNPWEWGPPPALHHAVLPTPYTAGDVRRVTVDEVVNAGLAALGT